MTEKATIIISLKPKISLSLSNQLKQTFINTIKYYPNMWYMFGMIILDGIISSYIGVSINKLIVED